MFRHLFKLIWNKKKENFLMITEMLVSFLVIFAVLSMTVFYYHNYRQPMGFDYEDVWVVNYSAPQSAQRGDSAMLFRQTIRQMLLSMPQIKKLSFAGSNVPFAMSTSNSNIDYNGKSVLANIYDSEISYASVLNMHLKEGRWFTQADEVSKYPPVVINEMTKEALFGKDQAVGKLIGKDNPLKVVGVVQNLKDKGDYQPVEYGMYKLMDTGSYHHASTILLKVQPGTDAAFEGKIFKQLSNAIGSSIEIEHLDKKLASKNKIFLVPAIIATIVAAFLIINVALGLFGVLWYNINKRRSEIGLRRAVGATGNSVSKQLVGEALMLSTFALIIGSFFAVQFPLLNVFDLPEGVYIIAMVLSILFIYFLVIICALYPGRQAAAIYPATALHED
ncbi:FtsX-like permease family protein [Ilyomonas limi]|uniref:FtsX-like permease family protein n=1 Tax=Ilyomonas limi TaxID=2575867 RepID=A0A4U3L032_9BACT|nr:FtsX-like permease family protein [Ilyomonas limi]TKK67464.1 FtsX-like permease family protein [Ilyomonas limi]